jgi:hypothetical protein
VPLKPFINKGWIIVKSAPNRSKRTNLRPLLYLAGGQRERGCQMPGFTAQANSSRTIKFDRFDLAVMAVHVQSDGTATDFAILNRGKRAGRSVNDRGEDRSAVGANNA